MNKKDLIKQLHNLSNTITPDADWKKSNQEILYNQITAQSSLNFTNNKISIYSRVFANNFLGFVIKPVASFVLMLAVIFGGYAASVSAMKNSMPGDLFYSAKLTSERVQVNLTLDDEKKTNLELEFAQRRLNEIDKIVNNDSSKASQKEGIEIPLQKFQESMTNVKSSLANLEKKDQQAAAKVANLIEEKTNEYLVVLEEHKAATPGVDENTQNAITASKDTADKALSIIIAEYEAGQSEFSAEQITERINKRISKLETNLTVSEQKIANIIENKKLASLEPADDSEVPEAVDENPADNRTETKTAPDATPAPSPAPSVTPAPSPAPSATPAPSPLASPTPEPDSAATTTETPSPSPAETSSPADNSTPADQPEEDTQEEQLPAIEDITDQPALVKLLLEEAQKLIADNQISAAFAKIKEADNILVKINKVINKNIEYLSKDFTPVFEIKEPVLGPETEIIEPDQESESTSTESES